MKSKFRGQFCTVRDKNSVLQTCWKTNFKISRIHSVQKWEKRNVPLFSLGKSVQFALLSVRDSPDCLMLQCLFITHISEKLMFCLQMSHSESDDRENQMKCWSRWPLKQHLLVTEKLTIIWQNKPVCLDKKNPTCDKIQGCCISQCS